MRAASTRSWEIWQIGGYTAVAAWATMVWDNIVTFDQEVKFIWPLPATAHIKWIYLFTRYFGLVLQTIVLGISIWSLQGDGISLGDCRIYRLVEMGLNTLLMLCFDVVLLLRIYALYGWRTWSSACATFGIFLEFVMTVVSAVTAIPSALYDSGCVLIEVPKTDVIFVVGTFVSQTILLWLAYRRREHGVRTRSSIAWVTIRDGLFVFVCFAAFLVLVLIWTLHDSPSATLLIVFVPLVTTIATSRIILNIHGTHNEPVTDEFTTDIYGVYGDADSFLLSDEPFRRHGPC